ncbi:MAG: PIN/TRAM domain-containing protein [Chloroflexota bacterium]
MIRFVRLVGGGLGVILAISLAGLGDPSTGLLGQGLENRLLFAAWVAAWFVVGFGILPYLTVVPARRLAVAVSGMSTGEFVAAIVGLVVGLLMGLLLGLPLANLPDPYGWVLPLGVSVVLGLGMMGLTIAKRHDLVRVLADGGILARGSSAASTVAAGPDPVTYLDTSAIVDGRVADLVAAGFLWGRLVVPRPVVAEIRHLADEERADRRARGRRALDLLAVLQKDHRVALELSDETGPDGEPTDGKLIALAQARAAAVLTTDFNLNRVAQLHGVRVMNLSALANALKPSFLPGDPLRVKVLQPGREAGQGVGYLEDGTMIVVEGGSAYMEQEVDVTVSRVLQTVAGRMVFAQVDGG